MHRWANPTRFMHYSAVILPWSVWITAALLGVGLYLALFVAPADYQQGDSVRIMFVHVPAAWMALFVYTGMAVEKKWDNPFWVELSIHLLTLLMLLG